MFLTFNEVKMFTFKFEEAFAALVKGDYTTLNS
jgi:hypothetical protein